MSRDPLVRARGGEDAGSRADRLDGRDAAAAAQLLSAACRWHPVSERRLRRKLFDHQGYQPDLALAVRGRTGRIDALAAAVVCGQSGSRPRAELVALATRPARRRRGLAGTLYAEIEARLQLRGVSEIAVGAGVLSSGLDLRYAAAVTMLLRRGFVPTGVVYDMALEPGRPAPELPGPEGFAIRDLAEGDRESLRALCAAEFPEWGYAPGLVRPGEPCGVIGAFDGQERLMAFAGWNEYIFGPTGTAAEHRGRGLGRAVFWRAVRAMGAAGFGERVCISVANVGYYARAFGGRVSAAAWHMRREIPGRPDPGDKGDRRA